MRVVKRTLCRFLTVVAALCSLAGAVWGDDALPQYPLERPQPQSWHFSGPFGVYDKAQLQRGLAVYQQVCAACHSLKFVAFRDLQALGYTREQIKAYAAGFMVAGAPDETGEVHQRPAQPIDYFPAPYANDKLAAFVNNGAVPPDLSLMARARAVPQPLAQGIMDIFTGYTAAGPDYIFALLTGYQDAPPGVEVSEGTWYNPYFISGPAIAMAPPLYDDMVAYTDGSPQTAGQYARDVSAFLMWSADPHLETRKKTGFRVLIFLLLFAGLAYYAKRQIWADVAK